MISLFLRKLLNSVSLCCILNISGHFLHPLKTSLSSGILVTLPDCPGLKFNTHILLFPFSRLMEMLNTLGARACVLEKYWVKGFNLGRKKKKKKGNTQTKKTHLMTTWVVLVSFPLSQQQFSPVHFSVWTITTCLSVIQENVNFVQVSACHLLLPILKSSYLVTKEN